MFYITQVQNYRKSPLSAPDIFIRLQVLENL